MATLSIGKSLNTIGVSVHNNSDAGTRQQSGFLTRFASTAQAWMERYGEYKYNHTDWQALRF
jgi:hypothetical protein